MAELLERHDLVRAKPSAWASLMLKRPDLSSDELIRDWAGAGHPLVVRRPRHDDSPNEVPLGLPLPPARGKQRIALTLAPDDIHSAQPPPLLRGAGASAPGKWHRAIELLIRLDASTRTFGSLAWQHLTGLPYLSAGSDLDLLWRLRPYDEIIALLDGIAAIAETAPMRIDGEVATSAGAVQWRELRGAPDAVVAKTRDGVREISRFELAGGMQ